MMGGRRDGHSKLVYDKATRTIVAVDPHTTDLAEHDALPGLVGLIDLILCRDDLTSELREALTTNHRIVTARAANAKNTRLLSAFSELQAAAQKVCDEMDRTHDTKPYPLKYTAPFGAIAELRGLLNKQYGLSR